MASTPTTSRPPTDDGAAALPPLDPELADAVAAPRLLTLRVGGTAYACPLDVVREVLPDGPATRLPGAPAHVLGLRNVRGRLLTVLDLARRLDPASDGATGPVLVLEVDGRAVGCRVDAVGRSVVMPPLEPPPGGAGAPAEAGNAGLGGIVLGIGELDGAPLVALDLSRFVRDTLVSPGER